MLAINCPPVMNRLFTVTSFPRWWLGAHSAIYIGTVDDAKPANKSTDNDTDDPNIKGNFVSQYGPHRSENNVYLCHLARNYFYELQYVTNCAEDGSHRVNSPQSGNSLQLLLTWNIYFQKTSCHSWHSSIIHKTTSVANFNVINTKHKNKREKLTKYID